MRRLTIIALMLPILGFGQDLNGPMVGHVDHMEARIWMQCPGGCEMQLLYREVGTETMLQTAQIMTSAEQGHTHTFTLMNLVPGKCYEYFAFVNGHQMHDEESLQFCTEPLHLYRDSIPDLRIALGSCAYFNEAAYDRPGDPYGKGTAIFDAIADESPDMMLWLGDNIYLREPDWGSKSGYLYRYTHVRSQPSIQRLLRTGMHYAIWDDHDFGPNDACGNWVNSKIARETFGLFWPNPTLGIPGCEHSTASAFQMLDADFFLLDNRTYRELPIEDGSSYLLGRAQIDALIQSLRQSAARFKFVLVGGQVLNTAAKYENHAQYPEERGYLLGELDRNGIEGVIFLSGDRHHTAMNEITLENGTYVMEFTFSPLSSTAYEPQEDNTSIVDGTVVHTQNFGLIELSGNPDNRTMKVSAVSPKGKRFWERTLPPR